MYDPCGLHPAMHCCSRLCIPPLVLTIYCYSVGLLCAAGALAAQSTCALRRCSCRPGAALAELGAVDLDACHSFAG